MRIFPQTVSRFPPPAMNLRRPFQLFAAALVSLLTANCATRTQLAEDGRPVNPYPPGTYEHFKAEPSYPKTHSVWKNEELLSRTNESNSHILIDLTSQRGFLMKGDQVAIDYPVCTGKKSHPTPMGTFKISEKIVDKSSNRYGNIVDADGKVVKYSADIRKDPVPEGGQFIGSPMRYWMRLTDCGVGMHVGPVRRYPASHACIRGPSATVPIVYSKVGRGTRVVIE